MFEDFEQEIEEAESAVALPVPREMSEWCGDDVLEKDLLALFESGRPPHAIIFSGPDGVGKSTMAFRLARYLLAGKINGADDAGAGLFGEDLPADKAESLFIAANDPVFQRVASGGHSDMLVIEKQFDEKSGKFKDTVAVEDVRRVTPFLRLTASTPDGWRVVIVDDSDTMTRSAQNAILKILEEPPAKTLLILIAHRPGALLPTIRSRSRLFSFKPLTEEQMRILLAKDNPALTDREIVTLYAISGGSIGKALLFQEEGGLEAVEKILGLLKSWPDWNWPEIHRLADALGRKGQEASQKSFEEILIWIFETILRTKARGDDLPEVLDIDAVRNMSAHYNLEDWIKVCEKLKEHLNMVRYSSLDKRQIVLGSFLTLDEIKDAA